MLLLAVLLPLLLLLLLHCCSLSNLGWKIAANRIVLIDETAGMMGLSLVVFALLAGGTVVISLFVLVDDVELFAEEDEQNVSVKFLFLLLVLQLFSGMLLILL